MRIPEPPLLPMAVVVPRLAGVCLPFVPVPAGFLSRFVSAAIFASVLAFPSPGDAEPGVPDVGLLLWLRADEAEPDEGSEGVAVWKTGRRVPRATPLKTKSERRPRRVASVEALGGRAAFEFDGIDDFSSCRGWRSGRAPA